ncbi:Rossmann-fold NAD(P)-binding domain-containing protein [Flavicella sediminum]|uniref:NAD(P)H-binding protein n=1 Tax=Flavicella sediminum TaxID=2585141 RepID=UPI001AA0A47D|nr:NAD(P)H-binding protein [Flavicella sediminum]
MDQHKISVVILGSTGAVGGEVLKALLKMPEVGKITSLGRSKVSSVKAEHFSQFSIAVFEPETYKDLLVHHDTAICTLGVGEPSKVSKEDFIKIDKLAVLDFAKACKQAGVKHFELLASVGISAKSSSFYLRIKGELVEELKALNFESLSVFQPSMIITPTNRYGFSQALTLAVWPVISKLFFGKLKKYRGIAVEKLGRAMAVHTIKNSSGTTFLTWDDFHKLQS